MAFDKPTRNRLAKFVSDARGLIADEFTEQFQSLYGISVKGDMTPLDKLDHLDEAGMATATLLRERIDYLIRTHPDDKDGIKAAVARLAREQAFTILNRLAAIRMAEKRGIIVESVGKGYQSKGFKVFETVAGSALGDIYHRYRRYLFCLFDELAVDLGILFDRRSPQALLFPREPALLALLDLLHSPELEPLWAEDETIGWIYQYYNDPEERKKMRKESAAPRNSRELAVRNQFFTPRYVVCFLSDNTLGRIWYEMTQGRTRLAEQCQYLVRRPDEVFLSQDTQANGEDPDQGPADAARRLQTGDQGTFPEFDATEESIQRMIALAHTVDGYVRHPAGEETFAWMEEFRNRVLLPCAYNDVKTLDLLDGLFLECRQDRQRGNGTIYDEPWFVNACNEVRSRVLRSREEGLSQEELLRQPVFISHRPIKDPREIRLLDPACGSMHFGLYAFDLFEVIYREAWELLPDFRDKVIPFIDPKSIQISSYTELKCAASGELLTPDTAVLAVWPYDAPGQTKPGRLLLYSRLAADERADRLSYCRPLAEVNWEQFLQEQWAEPSVFLDFLTSHAGFTFRKWSESERYEAFLKDVPRLIIEHNIHGIDIDPRAVQIAALSLWLRAQKAWQQQKVPAAERPRVRRSNIVCAEPMPGSPEMLEAFIATLDSPLLGGLIRTVFDKMQLAGEAGSLLKIEEEIRSAIDTARKEWLRQQDDLLARKDGSQEEFFDTAEQQLIDALRAYAEQADADSYQRRLFADDAARGFAFIDLCRKRYEVVVMNPPFGEPSIESTGLLKKAFPNSKTNMYACFCERGGSVLGCGGLLGAISSRSGFFQSSLTAWREEFVLSMMRPVAFADLGAGVLDAATVETACYVLQRADIARAAVFINALGSDDKAPVLLGGIGHARQAVPSEIVHVVPLERFSVIPGSPLAYSVSDRIRDCFKTTPGPEAAGKPVRIGLSTKNDERFVRIVWEVPPLGVGREKIWSRYANGGRTQPFYDDYPLVVKSQANFAELRSYLDKKFPYLNGNLSFILHDENSYNEPVIVWPLRALRFSPHALPSEYVFSARSYAMLFNDRSELMPTLALLASEMVHNFLRLQLGETGRPEYVTSAVRKLPLPDLTSRGDELASLAEQGVDFFRFLCSASETSPHFRCVDSPTDLEELRHLESEADALGLKVYGLDNHDLRSCGEPVSSFIACLNNDADALSHSPSFWFGTAFGRWDIRYATGERQSPPLPDPFDPLPVCPPGMLQNAEGLPAEPKDVPADYPLRISWPGILVDDENHPEDIVARVREAIEVIWKDRAEAIEQEACGILGVKTLREYLGKPTKFFADHLNRYSKSRRQAPIYWPLSTRSCSYTLWLYYHRLSDQTLHTCLADFLDPKIRRVQADLDAQRSGGKSQRAGELQEFLDELKDLREEIERVIKLPWKPNLNDGVLITASPLWKLFRLPKWQKDLKACWEKLGKGDYDWAHLAHSIWPQRVEKACERDRSIAIAHGLEHLCKVEPPKPKKKRGKKKAEDLAPEEDELEFGEED